MTTNNHIGTDTVDYCVLPQFIDSNNLFNGYQYYRTTEYMVGINLIKQELEGRHDWYTINNDHFQGEMLFAENRFYGKLLAIIKTDRYEWHACNGIETAPPFLQAMMKDMRKITEHGNITDLTMIRYFFTKLYKR